MSVTDSELDRERARLIQHHLGMVGAYRSTLDDTPTNEPYPIPTPTAGDAEPVVDTPPLLPRCNSAPDIMQLVRKRPTSYIPNIRGLSMGIPISMDPNNRRSNFATPPPKGKYATFEEPPPPLVSRWEAWQQIHELMVPTAIASVCAYSVQTVHMMFVGRYLGSTALAGVAVALYGLNMLGIYPGMGVAGVLDTLISQEFGRDPSSTRIGVYLQRSFLAALLFFVPVSYMLLHCQPVLEILFTAKMAEHAGFWLAYAPWYLFPMLFNFAITKFFQNQCNPSTPSYAVTFSVMCSPLLHLILIDFGIVGAIAALALTAWIQLICMVTLLYFSDQFGATWSGWSMEVLEWEGVKEYSKIGFVSMIYVAAEASCFDVTVLLAGVLGEVEVDAFSIILSCLGIMVSPAIGISFSVCTRVGNALGNGDIRNAKMFCRAALAYAFVLSLVHNAIVLVFHEVFFRFFTDDQRVVEMASKLVWLMCITHICDSLQFTFQGIFFGCGRSGIGALLLIGIVWCIGIPAACLLAFKLKLGAFGVLLGLTCGLFGLVPSQAAAMLTSDWKALADDIQSG